MSQSPAGQREPCPVLRKVLATADRYPSRRAVVSASHKASTYQDLRDATECLRRRLADLDVPPRAIVAVVTTTSDDDLASAFLGVRAAGLVPLLVDAVARPLRSEVLVAMRVGAILDLDSGDLSPVDTGSPRILPEEAGYVVFSSGSQGAPKAIVGQARGLAHFVSWEANLLGAAASRATALFTSPSFDVVLRDLFLPLFSGGELHIPARGVRTRPSLVVPWLSEREISVLHAVPSLAGRWADAATATVPSLEWTLFAGEPLLDGHIDRWRSVAPETKVVNLYGPSETTLAQFWYRVPESVSAGVQPVGCPLPGVTFGLEPVSTEGGAYQRVVIETEYGSLGYLPGMRTEDDAARLHRSDGVTRFHTLDRACLDADNNLVVEGRLDSLVKRMGEFVDTALIESAAADLDGVRAACCQLDEQCGRIVLVVESQHRASGATGATSVPALRRALQGPLGIELLPDDVMAVPRLPLLPSGKIDRQQVRLMLTSSPSVAGQGSEPRPDRGGADMVRSRRQGARRGTEPAGQLGGDAIVLE